MQGEKTFHPPFLDMWMEKVAYDSRKVAVSSGSSKG